MQILKLQRTIDIEASPRAVFELVSRVDYLPRWRGEPAWLPSALQLPYLTHWREPIASMFRSSISERGNNDQIHIRSQSGLEFHFCHSLQQVISTTMVFRISARPNGCSLAWEIEYSSSRLVDRFTNRRKLGERTLKVMGESLATIRRMAEATAPALRQDSAVAAGSASGGYSWVNPEHKAS